MNERHPGKAIVTVNIYTDGYRVEFGSALTRTDADRIANVIHRFLFDVRDEMQAATETSP